LDDGLLPGAGCTIVESDIVFPVSPVNANVGNVVLSAHVRLVPLILIGWREPAACTREQIMEKVKALFPENSLKA
jgi:hypothetical protein